MSRLLSVTGAVTVAVFVTLPSILGVPVIVKITVLLGGSVVIVDRAADDLHHFAVVQINAGTETHYFLADNSVK